MRIPVRGIRVFIRVARHIEMEAQNADDEECDSGYDGCAGAVDADAEEELPELWGGEGIVLEAGAPHEERLDGDEDGQPHDEEGERPAHKANVASGGTVDVV